MKINRLLLLSLSLFVAGCSEANQNAAPYEPGNIPSTSEPEEVNEEIIDPEQIDGISDVDSIQDMNVLHAWNWRISDVRSRLSYIKNAGYGAIQLSPLQPKVDKIQWSTESTSSQWWKLYQPLAFKVSEDNENFLGTNSELTALCAEAKEHGLKIVMDIVCNHLAGDKNGYSPQVYEDSRYPLHNWSSHADDNNGESVVKGHIDLPDLDTSNSQVQQDVLKMLKAYVDCGVSGFRFDAAKHIETPDDGSYASNFWPVVLDGTTQYAESKGLDKPYYYGEILNTCGAGRSFSSYTKMMSICDNKQGTSIVQAVNNNNFSGLKSTYDTGENPDHLMLWAESHDTYANSSGYDLTRSFSRDVINKAYMIQASRKDAATLYFARPSNMGVTICSIDGETGWKDKCTQAINAFHRVFLDKTESIKNNNNCFVNVRGSDDYVGAAIVNISASSSQNVNVPGMKDGTYVDILSNKEYTVSSETVNVSFVNGACLLVTKDIAKGLSLDDASSAYSSSIVIKGTNPNKSYLLWNWVGTSQGSWKDFSVDKDAIGVTIDSNSNYIIVEFPSGTTAANASWDKRERQTFDLTYSGSQIIYEYSSIVWK